MKQSNKQTYYYSAGGFLAVLLLGSLSHFFYEWSGNNSVVGLFAPVSESIWEHMKLLFFPMLLFSLLEQLLPEHRSLSLFCARTAGNILGTVLIPVLFYTYSGILGFHNLFFDIMTFIAATATAFIFSDKKADSPRFQTGCTWIFLLAAVIAVCFFIFTFYSPGTGIFKLPSV